jgi:mannose-6-phosphate isomerase-like protein (cupin superfamily)
MLAVVAPLLAQAQSPAPAPAPAPNTETLPEHCRTFSFDKLPAHQSATGAITRAVARGMTPTGEYVEIHETTLQPGQMPHPPHRHLHTEFALIREGTIEFVMPDRSEQIGPGGVTYCASGELHSVKNVGTVPANYFVVAIGKQVAL